MNLKTQFEIILTSTIFGFLFMIIFDFINRLMYNKKGKIIRLAFETIVFLMYTFSFFYVMLQINNNNLSIYVPIFLIVGMLIYNCTIQSIIQYTYEQFFKKINQKKLHIKAKFDIIKMERRKKKIEKYEKNQKSKKSYGYSEQT